MLRYSVVLVVLLVALATPRASYAQTPGCYQLAGAATYQVRPSGYREYAVVWPDEISASASAPDFTSDGRIWLTTGADGGTIQVLSGSVVLRRYYADGQFTVDWSGGLPAGQTISVPASTHLGVNHSSAFVIEYCPPAAPASPTATASATPSPTATSTVAPTLVPSSPTVTPDVVASFTPTPTATATVPPTLTPSATVSPVSPPDWSAMATEVSLLRSDMSVMAQTAGPSAVYQASASTWTVLLLVALLVLQLVRALVGR